jgi:hypothetical protein
MCPDGPETNNDYADEDQQQISALFFASGKMYSLA